MFIPYSQQVIWQPLVESALSLIPNGRTNIRLPGQSLVLGSSCGNVVCRAGMAWLAASGFTPYWFYFQIQLFFFLSQMMFIPDFEFPRHEDCVSFIVHYVFNCLACNRK